MSYNKHSFGERKNSNYRKSNSKFRGKRNTRSKQRINPAQFINKNIAEKTTATKYVPTNLFNDFDLNNIIATNLETAGFIAPSPVQDKAIPLILAGKDVIGLANTGTGKTAAFMLPILNKLATKRQSSSVLIMAPTRELAQQIDAEFRKFSAGMKLYSAVCVGGINIGPQIRQLQRGPHIIIGTPGRLKDLMDRKMINTSTITTLVLDEADRMLDMGFINDIKDIIGRLPSENRQTLCFSATMSEGVKKITHDFMHNPELVSVKVNETNNHIYQDIIEFVDENHKKDQLIGLLKKDDFAKVIVFGETKYGVQRLSDSLRQQGIQSSAIHGNKSQGQRNRALKAFANNEVTVLIATDVASRGLDIPDVSHVINFDLPQSYDDYIHRIGRTGRGGKQGTALTFVKNS